MRKPHSAIGIVLGAILVSVAALKFAPIPWFWVGLAWAIADFVIAALAPAAIRLPVAVAGSVPLALALAELIVAAPPEISRTVVPALARPDALLGWRPNPSQITHASATVGGRRIFDTDYSTDEAGHRIAPPDRGDAVEGCAFFFADSFVFGEGVADQAAFPYQVGLQSHGRFRIVNFAAPGYGAEHMLAKIERGELAGSPPCEPTHIFYVALPHHVARAAGKTDFSIRGPRYHLRADGAPEYVGTRPEPPRPGFLQRHAVGQLSKSRLYRALAMRPPTATDEDLALYFAIVREAFRQMSHRWPSAQLHIISWDVEPFYSKDAATFHAGLKTSGCHLILIDDILPGYTIDPAKYSLDPSDLHPNARAHRMVASYLLKNVLK